MQRFEKIRKIKRITQQILFEKVGVSRQYINEIEKGKKIPSIKVMYLIADELEVKVLDNFYFY